MKKKLAAVVIFLIICVMFNSLANYCLIQPGLARTVYNDAKKGGYDVILVGASHGSYGLDPEVIEQETGLKTMNMCMGGEFFIDSYYTLCYALQYLSPKQVVLDIDYQYLINRDKQSLLFNNEYNGFPDGLLKLRYWARRILPEDFRGAFLPWTNYWQCYKYIPKTIEKKQSDAYKNYEPSVVDMNPYDHYYGGGFVYRDSEYKKDTTPAIYWDESKVSSSELYYIKKIVKLCKSQGINIVFTTITQDPDMISDQLARFADADTYISNLANTLDVDYYNFNYLTQEKFARDASNFYDREGHMYGETAERFSRIFGKVLYKAWQGEEAEGLKADYFTSTYAELYRK